MTNSTTLFRALLIYGLCLPLAIFLGYMLASPLDFTTFLTLGLILLLLTIPILLNWHRPLLMACWNMSAVVPFLPGGPPMWLVMAGMSLLIAVLQRALNKNATLLNVPSLTLPLVFIAVVVLGTAMLTGGIGFGVTGGSSGGGKRYVLVLGAIMGYFALTSQRIPPQRAMLYVCLFFLGALTAVVGNMAPFVDPSLYFLFYLFPVEKAGLQAIGNEIVVGASEMARFSGLTAACFGIVATMLAVYGIRGLMSLRKGWRPLIFLGVILLSMLGSFRSSLVLILLTLFTQFCFERMYRTRLLPITILIGILMAAILLPVVEKLPLSIQRTLSVLPIKVDPIARYSAEMSNQWRVDMWRILLPDLTKYLLLGKGYALNAREIEMVADMEKSGRSTSMDVAMLAGDYHNGPLTLYVPLGLFGALGFIWFLAASLRALYRNYRYGGAALHNINTFLLASFTARIVFYTFVFGSFQLDFVIFTGIIGLSVALNGGVAAPEATPELETATDQLELAKV